jgi:hypothetical protein
MLASPHFFQSLRFRPEVDRLSPFAFTALSPEYGDVIVARARKAPVGAAARRAEAFRDAIMRRGGAPCALQVANVGYAYLKMKLHAPQMKDEDEELDLDVVLLGQMAAGAAQKALAKRFPAPPAALVEKLADHDVFLEARASTVYASTRSMGRQSGSCGGRGGGGGRWSEGPTLRRARPHERARLSRTARARCYLVGGTLGPRGQ